MSIEKDNYTIVKNMISKDICKITTQYALFDMLNDFTAVDPSVPNTHTKVYDKLMETLLLSCLPKMEETYGKKLIPTYTCYRVYKPGDSLADHTDRHACEISATVVIGYRHNDKPSDYRWPLYAYVGDEKRYLHCDIGDAVIYKGIDLIHGRDCFDVGKDSFQVQLFLHYIDANGMYTDHKYDKRPAIGYSQ